MMERDVIYIADDDTKWALQVHNKSISILSMCLYHAKSTNHIEWATSSMPLEDLTQ